MKLKEMLLEKNVGETDRRIRLAIGAVVFSGGVFLGNTLMGIIGLAVFITGIRGNCPMYSIGKHNTIEK